jgi:hypothetical protein
MDFPTLQMWDLSQVCIPLQVPHNLDELMPHPPYRSDLTLSHHHLFDPLNLYAPRSWWCTSHHEVQSCKPVNKVKKPSVYVSPPLTLYSTGIIIVPLRLEPHWAVTTRQDYLNKTRQSVSIACRVHTEQAVNIHLKSVSGHSCWQDVEGWRKCCGNKTVFRNGVKNEEREIRIQPLMKRKNAKDLISCLMI